MPLPLAIPLALSAGSFLSSLFSRKAANKQQVSTNTGTSTSNNTSTSMPTLDAAYKPLQDMILPSITKRLSNPGGLPAGYVENGIQHINDTFKGVSQGADNDLTARGLGTSPVAGAVMGNIQRGRGTSIADFLNSADEKGQDMENSNLAMALSALNFGRGNTSTSTGGSTQTGSVTNPGAGGNPLLGATGDLATTLGWLFGNGAFGKSRAMTPSNAFGSTNYSGF